MPFFNTLQSAEQMATTAADSTATTAKQGIELLKLLDTNNPEEIETMIKSVGLELLHFAGTVFVNILISFAIYIIGCWLLRRALVVMDIAFESRKVEYSVRSFLKSLVSTIFWIMLGLTIIQVLGINTSSLIAMLASAGLAIGMALSGTLQNFAGGVMVLFLKPYKVGDFITSQSHSGVVKEIMLFTTVLETPDRKTIFVPNSSISSSVIENASFANTRRVDFSVGISYGDSTSLAREVIMDILNADSRIMNNPAEPSTAPMIGIVGLGESSVDLTVRVWVKTADYWGVYFDTYEKIYETLPKRGVSFPFPQLDVHIQGGAQIANK